MNKTANVSLEKEHGVQVNKLDAFSIKMSIKHLRIAVIGNVDAGKSTFIGTIKSGILDNGKGHSRLLIAKHQHEIDSGRTSSISTHLIGYKEGGDGDGNGNGNGDERPIMLPIPTLINATSSTNNNVNTTRIQLKSEVDIATEANNLVSLIDLAGHEKYLKTTIHGVSSGMIDYALVLISSHQGPNHMTRHHISLAVAFSVPIIVVLTKIDSCPQHLLKNTKEEIASIIRSPGVQKRPYLIKQSSDINVVLDKMHAVVPIISISSVSGDGLDLIHILLSNLPKRRRHQNKIGRDFEFLIDGIYNIIGVGTIVSGFVNAGSVRLGENVFVGPLDDGSYMKTTIKGLQISRTNVNSIIAGNSAGLSSTLTKNQKKLLRTGMVVLSQPKPATRLFEAEMVIIKGHGVDGTTIKVGYETMAHILHLKQHVKVENIETIGTVLGGIDDEVVVRPGNRARITFRFMKRNEWIRNGMRILFRDGHVRGVGIIVASKD